VGCRIEKGFLRECKPGIARFTPERRIAGGLIAVNERLKIAAHQ
jgi:hypothetical protein